jgi:hypothetical protein
MTDKPDLTPVKDDLWAVWDYDQFPFYICAKVEAIDDRGFVKAEGYRGYRFKPVTLLHGAQGEAVKRYLAAAKSVKRDMDQGIRNATHDALRKALTDYNVPCRNVSMPQGFMWPIFGKAFEQQVAHILDERAPAFPFHGDLAQMSKARVEDPEPDPPRELKFTDRLRAAWRRCIG